MATVNIADVTAHEMTHQLQVPAHDMHCANQAWDDSDFCLRSIHMNYLHNYEDQQAALCAQITITEPHANEMGPHIWQFRDAPEPF